MHAALKRMRDRRQPADSGEFQPVPIRYITLKPAYAPAWGLRVPGPAGPCASFWRRALALVFMLFAQAATIAAVILAISQRWVEPADWLIWPMMLALPAASAAVASILLAWHFAGRMHQWRGYTVGVALRGLLLWCAIGQVLGLFLGWPNSMPLDPLLALWNMFASLLAAVTWVVFSLPGLLVILALEPPLNRRFLNHARRARARYYLTRGWRAP